MPSARGSHGTSETAGSTHSSLPGPRCSASLTRPGPGPGHSASLTRPGPGTRALCVSNPAWAARPSPARRPSAPLHLRRAARPHSHSRLADDSHQISCLASFRDAWLLVLLPISSWCIRPGPRRPIALVSGAATLLHQRYPGQQEKASHSKKASIISPSFDSSPVSSRINHCRPYNPGVPAHLPSSCAR